MNEQIDTFLGLNNMLNPASAEYREGMAWRSKDCRIDNRGLWCARPRLVGAGSGKATLLAAYSGAPGPHFKNLAVGNVNKLLYGLNTGDSCDVGTNGIVYSTTGSGAVKFTDANTPATGDLSSAFTPPVLTSATTGDGTQSKQENGIYYYMITFYDVTRKRESLPSNIISAEIDLDDGAKDRVVVKSATAGTSTMNVRFYRSKVTNATTGVYNATNIFYYIGELATGTDFTDYAYDDDISNDEYEGRGSIPTTAIDYLASFQNRMLYFKGSGLYWSSAGRPEEVAQQYTITYADSTTLKCLPRLSSGVYGEAKFDIAELDGHKVTGAMKFNGRLYVWTATMTGYLEASYKLEGYKFKIVHKGIGLVNDKCLAFSPYGIFGADRLGIWLLTNNGKIVRLSEGVIDILSGEDTTLVQGDISESFGLWVPPLNEYLWCMTKSVQKQIVYQADRGIFVGPYTHSIRGGCSFVGTDGAQAYVSGDRYISGSACDTAVPQYLEFWMGQSAPTIIKQEVVVELVHSAVPLANVTARLYQNSIPSETGAVSSAAVSYAASTQEIYGKSQGRFFKLDIILPAAGAPLANINRRYTPVYWRPEDGR